MSILLIFLFGILFLAGILFIKPRVKKDVMWKTVLVWALYGVGIAVLWMGVSFVYINANVGHAKATSTAIFLFGGIAVVVAVILARMLGFIGNKKVTDNKSVQA
ncbi:MAG: dehalogenase [Dehalobacter sp. 4CP]|uniref:dehalogenase n=1 Tax=Dehalobacter sp. CP TaxID=2594474 RepID=UPI0013C5A213|nr:dehalogenase [Dehalobacter sp. 4CP]